MTLQEIQKILSTKKRGTYLTIRHVKHINDYTKDVKSTIRLIGYKDVKVGDQISTNCTYLGNNLILNNKNGKISLMVFLTQNKYHRGQRIYSYAGEVISREEFYEGTKQRPSNADKCFRIDIAEIVAVY